ncbi:MAG: DUF3810 domain-containing protein [Chitinophagaceae bacterium]
MNQFLPGIYQRIRKHWGWLLLVALAVFIHLFSGYPTLVERYYTYGVYPVISSVQRFLFGWLPFSVGDLFYAFVVIFLIVRFARLLKTIFKRKATRQYVWIALRKIAFFCLSVYVLFNLLWGLNYSRVGIATQLGLNMQKYSVEELDTLTAVLQTRLNDYVRIANDGQRGLLKKKRNLFDGSYIAYQKASATYPFLNYSPKSIKPSMFSYVGNILGFTGYYNPFSGEAQVNTTVPVFLQPFIACHEIGHQLGYGKENEANFSGFLACRSQLSPIFRYSVYFDMYNYTIGELYRKDSIAAKHFVDGLDPLVKKDFREVREFFNRYQNPIEPIISWMYSGYLKANRQPAGKETYSQVVAFLIAYQKKFGKESL